jgi:hypothetical protein
MNWRRGLFRLWIVASLCWVGLVGWYVYAEENARLARVQKFEICRELEKVMGEQRDCTRHLANLFEDIVPDPSPSWTSRYWLIRPYASWALFPPLGVLIAGILGAWIFAGFRRDGRRIEHVDQ